ncbi:carboxypeptidase regulatory-like domain-containing protein [Chitinimonas sp.]|uniref:TonB-dependent receptor n=1 Tax=Chitinimonas sp. TaxID=1934313 RepID=UPI0035AE84AB
MNQSHLFGFSRSAISIAVAVMVAPAFAQDTTSALGGRITTLDGKAIAGAAVTIVHVESGSTTTTNTNADGRYVAKGLRVGGPYKVTVSKDGASDSRDGLYIELGQSLEVDVALGQATEKIQVTGKARSDKFNSSNMGAGTSLGRRELENQASINRNLQDYARNDPRLAQTSKDRGEVAVAGQNSRYNSVTVDGITISDTFGLESNNLPTAKQPISIDAIQSVQVNVSNYDVTQVGYTGANINAVTRSGTNDFKGSVYYVYRDDSLAGDRYNRVTDTYFAPSSFKEDTKGFTFGGPIIKDKLFFFTNYEELISTRTAPSFAPLGVNNGGTTVGITQSAIAGAQQIGKQFGFDAGSFDGASAKLKVKDYLAKLDWNINADHRASLRYTKTEQTEPIYPNFFPTTLSLNSNWYTQNKTIETTVGQWFANWNEKFNTEAKLSLRDYDSVPKNNAFLPQMTLSFSGPLPDGSPAGTDSSRARTLIFGTEQSRHFNLLKTKTLDGYFAGNLLLGEHEVKLGTDFSRNEIQNAFLQNTYGTYTFSCQNSTATYTYSFGAVNCGTANAKLIEQATLENFRRGRPSGYTLQVGAPGYTLNDGVANWTLSNTGLFAQDTWTISPKLNLLAGIRIDKLSTGDKPLANAAAAAPMVPGVLASNTRQSGGFGLNNAETIDGASLVQPRLGFNYRFKNTLQTQVRGGFGLFQGAAANVWLTNPYQNTGVATRIVGCGGSFPACPSTDGLFNADPNKQVSNLAGNPPAANVDFIENGLNQPSVWKANLAIEQELPWGGLVLSAEHIYTRVNDGLYYRHLNLGTATRKGSDGRDLYYTAQGYDTACWTSTGASISNGACTGFRTRALNNPLFNDVLIASKTHKGDGNATTVQLSKPFSKGFGWSLAYTRTSATEVSGLTSSVSRSNWIGRASFDPNAEEVSDSASLIRDRLSGSLSFERVFFSNLKTKIGVFYEGRTGRPYSWTYSNDLNGDGISGNDLMFIPSGPQSGQVVFKGDTAASHPNEDRFWAIVDANEGLRGSKGSLVKRNNDRSGWVNSIDMRVTQELPAFASTHKATLTFDFLNIGNMLNKKWGRIDEVDFQGVGGGTSRSFVSYAGVDAQGRYIYNVLPAATDQVTRQAKGESQWAVQATMRYEF